MTTIEQTLLTLFQRYRIVFWYDKNCELRGEFDSLMLPGVELIELANNEFGVKYRILRENPEGKFLIYHEGPQPTDLDNWLLDVQLANGMYYADQSSVWLTELGLTANELPIVQTHAEFFTDASRRQRLKALLTPEESHDTIRLKMLAICAECEPAFEEVLYSLLAELGENQTERSDRIRQVGLDAFLWERLGRKFGYRSTAPSVKDFAIELFKSAYRMSLGEPANLTADALVFVKRWKDSISHLAVFEQLSAEFAALLAVEKDLVQRDIQALVDVDLFRVVDQKILSELVRMVANRTASDEKVTAITRARRKSHWFEDFQHVYAAIDDAAQLFQAIEQSSLTMATIQEGISSYARAWYLIDQLYRKVIFHARKSGQYSLLASLMDQVENQYTNNYLLKLNNHWQQVVDRCEAWRFESVLMQRSFYEQKVAPVIQNRKKTYVIISDALRYEVAEELLKNIRKEDRFDAQLEYALAMLPSYTQLGMAALLPNHSLQFAEGDTGAVCVDGMSTIGTQNRDKILKQATQDKAVALRAEELLQMNRDDMRELLRENDVMYVYHNHIDAVGDKRESEDRVFEAVEETLEELLAIVKKLTNANATNLIITSDHGFIYQNRSIEESDFTEVQAAGDEILFQHRRFVLGKGLKQNPSLKKFDSSQLGLTGDVEVQIAKSISRMRQKGSGSRYIHGGSALQEVVIPVLQINKKRESDIKKVAVDILRGAASVITSGQFSVTFYQVEPISEKVQPRRLRAGIYNKEGELISDSHELSFDVESDNPRQRESATRFILISSANQFNNQEVTLRLEEEIPGTSHYQVYKTAQYTLRRSFTSDFDF